MSREFFSRGKRLDNGEWVDGYYVKLWDSTKERESHRIYTGNAITDCGEFYPEWYEIDPETVGKCTGCTDKNEQTIFEGDVLYSICTSQKYLVEYGEYQYVNEYDESEFMVGWCLKNKDGFFEPFGEAEHWAIVIGNIHDDPQILECQTLAWGIIQKIRKTVENYWTPEDIELANSLKKIGISGLYKDKLGEAVFWFDEEGHYNKLPNNCFIGLKPGTEIQIDNII